MGSVTGLTAARMLEIEAASIVDGEIDGDGHLILTQHDGTEIDAGNALVAINDNSVIRYLDATVYDNATPPLSYPDGITLMYVTASNATADWTTFSGKWGSIRTVNYPPDFSDADTEQTWTRLTGSGDLPEQWIRSGNNASGWTDWKKIALVEAGTKVQLLTAPAESAGPASYPLGVSVTAVYTGSGWSINTGLLTLLTVNFDGQYRMYQSAYSVDGGSAAAALMWVRTYHDTDSWTPWAKMPTGNDPVTMGFTGEIKMWPAAAAPTGWMLCEGGAISRTTYATLFALIGTTYGVGNGSTTFNVPDFRGRVGVGLSTGVTEFAARGQTGGEITHQLTTAEMPQHTHTQTAHGHTLPGNGALTDGSGTVNYNVSGTTTTYGFKTNQVPTTAAVNQNTGGDGAHNNLQPYVVIKYIIKL